MVLNIILYNSVELNVKLCVTVILSQGMVFLSAKWSKTPFLVIESQ